MKKSDIIDKVEKLLYDSWEWKSGDRHLATKIIELIEKEGMLPPEIIYEYDVPTRHAPLRVTRNEWEPEL